MQTTHPGAIRTDFETQLEALTPSATAHQDRKWVKVPYLSKVPSGEIRGFYIEHSAPSDDGRFTHGDGRDYSYECAIWTSYGGLSDHEFEDLRAQDAMQVAALLQQRYQPTVAGLISVEELGWEDGEGSDVERRWGAHTFEVVYFGAHTA